MEYADGGDLFERINTAQGHYLSETQILNWFTQIALAIKHCHDRLILHRDLKSQNIFMTANGNVKLGDFGISKILEWSQDKTKTLVGTPYYLSPEIIQKKPYSYDADIWSLGVLLYEMCCLKPPFDSESLSGLILSIINGKYEALPDSYSNDIKDLVKDLLNTDSQRRPTIDQILNKPFIHGYAKKLLDKEIYDREFGFKLDNEKPHHESYKKNSSSRNGKNSTTDNTGIKTVKHVRMKKDHNASSIENYSDSKHIELPKLSTRLNRALSPYIYANKIRDSSIDKLEDHQLLFHGYIKSSKRIEERKPTVLAPLNSHEYYNKKIKQFHNNSAHSVNAKPDRNLSLIHTKVKRSIFKAINDYDKVCEVKINTRNKSISKTFDAVSLVNEKSQEGKKKVYKVTPINIFGINKKNHKESELENSVLNIMKTIVKHSQESTNIIKKSEKDIDRINSEEKHVLF